MTNETTPSAKQQVLNWVRSKNPQTMELKFGCYIKRDCDEQICRVTHTTHQGNRVHYKHPTVESPASLVASEYEILGSDMGLQELLIAFNEQHKNVNLTEALAARNVLLARYDLTQNLHNQSQEFYQSILPLIQ